VHWALDHFRDWRSTGDDRTRANPPGKTGAGE
jgi:hypothetical protein